MSPTLQSVAALMSYLRDAGMTAAIARRRDA
jgi:hypothetical protein